MYLVRVLIKYFLIFYLDKDPVIAAQMSCDKHCVKMILESAQMLSTAHRVLDGDDIANEKGMYKMAHKNHPSTIWTRSSVHNYMWLYVHMTALMNEYTYRYGKHHATERLLEPLSKPPSSIPMVDYTDPPQCMPDEFKEECSVSAYRHFYNVDKRRSFKCVWTDREEPQWWKEHICLEVSL